MLPRHRSAAACCNSRSVAASLAVTASLVTFLPANRAGLQGFSSREVPTDRGRSGSNLLDFASPRAPLGAPVRCPSAWPRPSAGPSALRSLTSPRCRHRVVRPLPEGASTRLWPTAATRSVPFRPRGFSPPRRFSPHSVCGLVASRCQPGFARLSHNTRRPKPSCAMRQVCADPERILRETARAREHVSSSRFACHPDADPPAEAGLTCAARRNRSSAWRNRGSAPRSPHAEAQGHVVEEPISRVLFSRASPQCEWQSFIYDVRHRTPPATNPKARADHPRAPSYSVLLRMGFAKRPALPWTR